MTGEELFRRIWTWAFPLALVVVLFISLAPKVGAQTHSLEVFITARPQPLSWLGFYDVLFPVELDVLVHNPSNETFPGGNLTGSVTAPSGKWILPLSLKISEIAPNKTQTLFVRFKPQEAGVYTVQLDRLELPLTLQKWDRQVSYGFLPIQVEPPSTLINTLILIALILGILAIVAFALILRRKAAPRLPTGQPAPTMNNLLSALNQFDAGKSMKSYLTDGKNHETLVSAVSWLLQILGFHAMKLNNLAKGETLRIGDEEKGSADILAYDSQTGRLFLVNCTTGVPDHAELQKIKNSAQALQLGTYCDAILITSQNAQALDRDARSMNIILLDEDDLRTVTTLIEEKRFAKAKKIFE